MLYTRPTFTCPAAPNRTTDEQWDFAVLPKDEFIQKHGADKYEQRSQAQ